MIGLMIPGFILGKLKMIKDDGLKTMTNILVYVAQPFMLISSFQENVYRQGLLVNMGWSALLAFGSLLLAVFFSLFVFKLIRKFKKGNDASDLSNDKVYALASSLSNCGFMGIPVIKAMFPGNADALLYSAVFIAMYNVFFWTVVTFVFTGEKKYISIKKAILNPSTIALIVALPLFFTSVTLPEWALRGVNGLGDMATPLCMLILGVKLSRLAIKELFNEWGVYVTTFMKLVVIPLIIYVAVWFLPIDETVRSVVYISMAMPSASMVLVLCELFGGNGYAAGKVQLLSTVLSIFSVPLLVLLM